MAAPLKNRLQMARHILWGRVPACFLVRSYSSEGRSPCPIAGDAEYTPVWRQEAWSPRTLVALQPGASYPQAFHGPVSQSEPHSVSCRHFQISRSHMACVWCYGLKCVPLKCIHWGPNPHVIVLGDEAFTEIIDVKRGQFLVRRNRDTKGMHAPRGKAMWGQNKKSVVCKPQREASEETEPANTLILDF